MNLGFELNLADPRYRFASHSCCPGAAIDAVARVVGGLVWADRVMTDYAAVGCINVTEVIQIGPKSLLGMELYYRDGWPHLHLS